MSRPPISTQPPVSPPISTPEIRRDTHPAILTESEFKKRFLERFKDPSFDSFQKPLSEMANVAWKAHSEGRKSPRTKPAGAGFSDPNYELSEDWLHTHQAIQDAQARHDDPLGPPHILIISGADRNDQTCPGELSKTRRLVDLAQEVLTAEKDIAVSVLDLSQMISQFGRQIYPCKACVSTAMPLCHWPCSCYPNYSLGQVGDWMADIYPLWVEAHGILIITPVYWYQAPSALKLMIDRLVCADGGNSDPTSTHGKTVSEAKQLELEGWPYPKHLAGRMFSVVVHGDAAGVNHLQMALTSWLKDMELLPCGTYSDLGRYVGYYEPYATSHSALDRDLDFQAEVKNVAVALAAGVRAERKGLFQALSPDLKPPRQK